MADRNKELAEVQEVVQLGIKPIMIRIIRHAVWMRYLRSI